jgi:heme exporter protein A
MRAKARRLPSIERLRSHASLLLGQNGRRESGDRSLCAGSRPAIMSWMSSSVPAPVDSAPLLQCKGIGKRFGRRWIFRAIEFSLARGQVMVITGANGSGKSTLLQIVAGLQEPSTGEVGRPLEDWRTSLSYAAIDQAVYPSLTVREHLELAARLRGCQSRVEELLEQVGLPHATDFLASHLSTGMRGRLKLALAIQPNPLALLLDEPGAGLDEDGRALVSRIIEEQRGRGATIIATNDPMERRLADLELKLAG